LRRALVGIACGLVLLAGVTYTTFGILEVRAIRAAHHLDFFMGSSPPERIIVCRRGPTPDCIAAAAQRSGLRTAWLSPAPGYRLKWVVAYAPPGGSVDRGFSDEVLASDRLVIYLDTQPQGPPDYNMHLIGTYAIAGDIVNAFIPTDSAVNYLTFSWKHLGRSYSLSVYPLYLLDQRTFRPKDFVGLVATVQYAEAQGDRDFPLDSETQDSK